MEKLTDQELDSLFKAAAEGIKPEYEVAAWEGMNERLNASAKPPLISNKWLPLSLLGLIIFSGGVWLGYTLSNSSMPNVKEKADQILTESKTVSIDNQSLSKKAESRKEERETDDVNQILNSDKNSHSHQPQNQEPITRIDAKQNANDRISEKQFVDQIERNGLQKDGFENVTNLQQDETTNKLVSREESMRDSSSIAKNESRQKADSTNLISEQNDTAKARFTKGLFIRGLASPDFSSIDFGRAGATGSNYALLIEYQFSNRWSVSTGAIRSFKKYSSNGEIIYSGRRADNLEGACRILDIPLTLYYRLKPLSKISFFVGAGLSSYVMLSEDYSYIIYTTNGDRVYSKQVEKENNEWFKVLNLSVGVQYQLSSRLHVQAEPFLKAPLAGMGYGDVRLSSLGVFFGAKYKLK
jgi:opacity protein-like surface antigen